jgi:epoxyqueuosine reductase QueG
MSKDIEKKMEKLIIDYVSEYMKNPEIKTTWKKPIVAFASANDPMFHKLKEVANPNHLMPDDILPGAKSVITYFLPFDESIPISNMKGKNSSLEWARAYVETNKMIGKLNDFLIDSIKDMGYKAAKLDPKLNMDYENLISVWSNRHVAYIAGLGTFGLNNMLITKNGCCGRLGNVVTDLELIPTKRPGHEYCLFKFNGSCAYCATKCVNDALHRDKFDRYKCYEMCLENDKLHSELNEEAQVCGKCLTVVPCSFNIPL